MEQKELVENMQGCAELLYQNREAEAYECISHLLMPMNQALQELAVSGEEGKVQEVFQVMEQFLNAYQLKDNLALADILYYSIPTKMEEIRNGYFREE